MHPAQQVWYAGPVQITLGENMRRLRHHTAFPRLGAGIPLLAALVWAFTPAPAWAVQVHGDPEGYLVHQMAHLFFGAALVFLLYVLHQRPPGTGRPWRQLQISLLLFLLWDLDTTVVHGMATRLQDEALLAGATLAGDQVLLPTSWPWLLYYVGSLDHLLCVPAAWFLLLSLKGLGAEVENRLRQRPLTP